MELPDLLPCPFCDGEPDLEAQIPCFEGASVHCYNCGIGTTGYRVVGDDFKADKMAIDQWNTRPEKPKMYAEDEYKSMKIIAYSAGYYQAECGLPYQESSAGMADLVKIINMALFEARETMLHDNEKHTPDGKTWIDDRPYVCEESAYRRIEALDAEALAYKYVKALGSPN